MSATHAATVLNVEDNEAIRYVRTRLLEREGYRVLEAATGLEALQLLRAERVALVILDVHLPDVSGFDICKQIKEDRATAGTCVMQISAYYTSSNDRARGLDSRADSYLMEPVSPEEFLASVNTLVTLPTNELHWEERDDFRGGLSEERFRHDRPGSSGERRSTCVS